MDRNIDTSKDIIKAIRSLSARRAWIEIEVSDRESLAEEVALRKESVDRIIPKPGKVKVVDRRSPQGERG